MIQQPVVTVNDKTTAGVEISANDSSLWITAKVNLSNISSIESTYDKAVSSGSSIFNVISSTLDDVANTLSELSSQATEYLNLALKGRLPVLGSSVEDLIRYLSVLSPEVQSVVLGVFISANNLNTQSLSLVVNAIGKVKGIPQVTGSTLEEYKNTLLSSIGQLPDVSSLLEKITAFTAVAPDITEVINTEVQTETNDFLSGSKILVKAGFRTDDSLSVIFDGKILNENSDVQQEGFSTAYGLWKLQKMIPAQGFQDVKLQTLLSWISDKTGQTILCDVETANLRHYSLSSGTAYQAIKVILKSYPLELISHETEGKLFVGKLEDSPHYKETIELNPDTTIELTKKTSSTFTLKLICNPKVKLFNKVSLDNKVYKVLSYNHKFTEDTLSVLSLELL